jgi:hypothetical protein
VLFTEVAGAFLVGAALGGLIAPQLDAAQGARPRAPGPPGRFGGFDWSRLPFLLGVAAAGVAILIRIDFSGLFFRGPSAHGALTTYMESDAVVVRTIPREGYGSISVRDGVGNPMAIAATADQEIPVGTTVRITGRRGPNPVVTPVAGPPHS